MGSYTRTGVGVTDTVAGQTVATFPSETYDRLIDHIAISGIAGTTCKLYVGTIDTVGFRDGSSTGVQDVAEYPTGLTVPRGLRTFLVWNSAALTAQCLATVQFAEVT